MDAEVYIPYARYTACVHEFFFLLCQTVSGQKVGNVLEFIPLLRSHIN